jgi:uncharacterized protein (TIGR02246 family)
MSYLRNFTYQLFAAALLVAGLMAASPAWADDAKHRIDALNAKWVAAFAAKDIAAIETMMAPDALLLSPGAPAVKGAKAIAETWKGWSELANVEVTFGAERVEASASGDMAYDYGTYTFAFDGDKGRVIEKGKYIVVWKKIDGAWKVAADIYNDNGTE